MIAAGVGRRTRTAIAAVATVLLAVLAHALGHGQAPPIAALLPVTGAVWAVGHVVTARRVAGWQILLLIGMAQTAIHGLSVIADSSHGQAAATMDPVMMTASHVVSTVATALLLAYGEKVWWSLLSWIRRGVLGRYSPLVIERPRRMPIFEPAPGMLARLMAGSVGMRAPPAPGR